jgi:hypothetical protein
MRIRRSTLIATVASCSFALSACSAFAAPTGGGLYEGHILLAGQSDEDEGELTLLVANDGLSFEDGFLTFFAPCGPKSAHLVQASPVPITLIDSTGAFSWSTDDAVGSFDVVGRFAEDGGVVEGRMSFVDNTGRCVAHDVPLRARVTGRPASTRPGKPTACGRVPGRNGEIVGWERRVGCTRAKLLALEWTRHADCRRSPSRPACLVDGFACLGVHGAKYSRQASVRCTAEAPGLGAVEFGIEVSCGYVTSARTNVYAMSIGCRAARRIVRLIPAACPETDRVGHQCEAGPYRCRVTSFTGDSTLGRCLSRRDPFYALRFEYVWPV